MDVILIADHFIIFSAPAASCKELALGAQITGVMPQESACISKELH